jgi:hypothetical protein
LLRLIENRNAPVAIQSGDSSDYYLTPAEHRTCKVSSEAYY